MNVSAAIGSHVSFLFAAIPAAAFLLAVNLIAPARSHCLYPMNSIDYFTIGAFLFFILLVGLSFARKAGKSSLNFILGGRKLPWWLAGISNAAEGYNADSAIHQTAKIRQTGLSGMWTYWSKIIGDVGDAIIFGRLWRRAEITTPIEFYVLRYHGKAVHVARVLQAGYVAFVLSMVAMIMGLVAMRKLIPLLFGLPEEMVVLGIQMDTDLIVILSALTFTMIYSTASGLMGIVVTDFLEFFIAIGCSYLLTYYVFQHAGWASGLKEGLAALPGGLEQMNLSPKLGLVLVAWLIIQPLSSLQTTGSQSMRYMSVRTEKDAIYTGIMRTVLQWIIRGWPWYIAGLATLVVLPQGVNHEDAYPMLVNEFMPAGLKGLMVAGFLAAFMSSVDSGMHTSSSIFMNDIYRPYIRKNASERHYVWMTRVGILVYSGVGAFIALNIENILGVVLLYFKLFTATGMIMVLRWFWWRVNIYADIAAMAAALPITLLFDSSYSPSIQLCEWLGWSGIDARYGVDVCLIFLAGSTIWISAMFMTRPEPEEKLVEFYKRVRPYGCWGPIAKKCPEVKITDSLSRDLYAWGLGIAFCYSLFFTFAKIAFAEWAMASFMALLTAVFGVTFFRVLKRSYS
jgi:Na+/proline symporter